MRRTISTVTVALAATLFAAGSACAQLASDLVPRERVVSRSEQLRQDLEESRFRVGPLRITPAFTIRDLGYDNNVFGLSSGEAIGDWKSTVSAGADVILPAGRKLYFTGSANPQYTYYRKLAERRTLGGRYGGSMIALFNRMSVEAGGNSEKSIGVVNSELERSVPGRRTNAFARSEVEIFRRLSIFAGAERQAQRYQIQESELGSGIRLAQLERNETSVTAGVRYNMRSFISYALSVERGRSEFLTARESNNETRAIIFGLRYDRPRSFVNLSVGSRSGEPRGPLSTFPKFSTTTGSYYAAYKLGAPIVADAYGYRSLVYGLAEQNPYYFETRNGLGLVVPVGDRIGLRLFSEIGTNDYPVASARGKRQDDVLLLGSGISYRFYRKVILTVVGSYTDYKSNNDEFNRSVLRIATLFSLRGETFR